MGFCPPKPKLNMRDKIGIFNPSETQSYQGGQNGSVENYSTVTDFARFLGWSTLHPRKIAIW